MKNFPKRVRSGVVATEELFILAGPYPAVLTAGSYGYVLSSHYNTRPRPAEVLVHGAEAELIRPRETLESLMAAEKL